MMLRLGDVKLGDEMIRLGCVIVRLWSMLD